MEESIKINLDKDIKYIRDNNALRSQGSEDDDLSNIGQGLDYSDMIGKSKKINLTRL
nr:hypothetical protein [uncultured Peptostreptococcus sp.]